MSKDLKKRGWAFLGPTTIYSFMQSAGIVNDHIEGCDHRDACEKERAVFTRPLKPEAGARRPPLLLFPFR